MPHDQIPDEQTTRRPPMAGCMRCLCACALVLLAIALRPTAATAQEGDDFYRGKTITIIIPIGTGGAYDAYARLISRHLGKWLPGNPTIIARNMPGGGGVIASNYLYNVAPQDGTTLAIITSSFVNEQIFDNPQIRYDARKFGAIGRLLDTTSVLFFWHASPIKTIDDMLHKPSTIAISSVNEAPAYRLRRWSNCSARRSRSIPGYPSARDYVLAVERGETDGGSSTFIGLSQLYANYIAEKKLNILVQFATERDRDHADIPTVLELTSDPEAQADFPAACQQRRDRALAVHHAECPAGAACAAARGVPENDRRSGVSRGGAAAQPAARHQDRRRNAKDRRRQFRDFAGGAGQAAGADQAVIG